MRLVVMDGAINPVHMMGTDVRNGALSELM